MQVYKETITSTCFRLIKDLTSNNIIDDFYLVGGTSLALQIGHRLSIDLDFFTHTEFHGHLLANEIPLHINKTNLTVKKNFLGSSLNEVKTEFMYFAYPYYYPLKKWQSMKLLDPRDIGLFKLLAILGRNRKKDIVDLFFIDQEIEDLGELFKDFVEKYDSGDVNIFKQLETLFDDEALMKSDMPVMLKPIDFDKAYKTVKLKITKAIRKELGINY